MLSEFTVVGGILKAYAEAFKAVPGSPRSIFVKHGLGHLTPSGELEPTNMAPLDKVIAAMNELLSLLSPQKAFELGQMIVNHVAIPPGATDIITSLQILDAGYHLNHHKDGAPMFDPATGAMVEGIGHYKVVSVSNHRVVMEVDAPYNCDLDRGIMQGWVRRFERTALVTHLDTTICRKNRSPRCRYEVSWK